MTILRNASILLVLTSRFVSVSAVAPPGDTQAVAASHVLHRTANIDGLEFFNRAAGPIDAPVALLLDDFPTSSQMFRNLIPGLAVKYHVIASDYPGYGRGTVFRPFES